MRHRVDKTALSGPEVIRNIGVAQWRLDCSGAAALYRAAQLGFTAIHVDAGDGNDSPFLYDTAILRSYQNACKETSISITGIAVNVLNRYGLYNTENAHRSWQAIQSAIDAAAALEVHLVFLPSFHKSEIHNRDELLRTAEVLRRACLYGAGQQVFIATENSLGTKESFELIQQVEQPNFRLLFDTQNPVLWGHKPEELIEELHTFFCNQIHVKDGQGGMMGNTLLTKGLANIPATLQALQEAHFSGDIILENDYRFDTAMRVKHDQEVLKSLLHLEQEC